MMVKTRSILRKYLPDYLFEKIKIFTLNMKYGIHFFLRIFDHDYVNPTKFIFVDELKLRGSILIKKDYKLDSNRNNHIMNDLANTKYNQEDFKNLESTINVYCITDLIFFKSEWLLKTKNCLIVDSRIRESSYLKSLRIKNIIFNSSYNIFDKSKKIPIEDAYVINAKMNNYYHFTFEVLLKLIYITNFHKYSKNVVIIMPEKTFQLEAIDLMSKSINFYFCDNLNSYKIRNAYILEYNNNFKEVETASNFNVLMLRNYIKSNYKFKNNFHNKIYIKRKSEFGRNVINSVDFEKYLVSLGFLILSLESLSLNVQYEYFFNANFIIAAHGAGLTNLVTSKSNTTLIEIQHINRISNYFVHLSNNLGIKHHLYIDYSNSNEEDPNLYVDIQSFHQKFNKLLNL